MDVELGAVLSHSVLGFNLGVSREEQTSTRQQPDCSLSQLRPTFLSPIPGQQLLTRLGFKPGPAVHPPCAGQHPWTLPPLCRLAYPPSLRWGSCRFVQSEGSLSSSLFHLQSWEGGLSKIHLFCPSLSTLVNKQTKRLDLA